MNIDSNLLIAAGVIVIVALVLRYWFDRRAIAALSSASSVASPVTPIQTYQEPVKVEVVDPRAVAIQGMRYADDLAANMGYGLVFDQLVASKALGVRRAHVDALTDDEPPKPAAKP